MMARDSRRPLTIVAAGIAVATLAACNSEPVAANSGSIAVTAVTTGDDLDSAYTVTLDEADGRTLGANHDNIVYSDLPAGNHSVGMANVSVNCAVGGNNPQTVGVTLDSITHVEFQVTCERKLITVISFTASGDLEHPSPYNLFLMKSDGTDRVRLTYDSVYNTGWADWSPDGQKLTFSSDRDGDAGHVYVMNPDGTDQKHLSGMGPDDGQVAWSPDGTKFAFTRVVGLMGELHITEIWVMDADGSNQVRLTGGHWDQSPRWSPDGAKIVFTSDRNRVSIYQVYSSIYVMNADGSNITNLTRDGALNFSPAWTPNGAKIVFVSNRDGNNYHLFIMNADGTAITQLTNGANGEYDPDVSPDGRFILFSSTRDTIPAEIYVMRLDGAGITRLTHNQQRDVYPRWRP